MAVISLIVGDQLYVANAGDSRALLVSDSKVVPLTCDSDAADPATKRLILERNGQVQTNEKGKEGVYTEAISSTGNINRSHKAEFARQFGDFFAHGCTILPEINKIALVDVGSHPRLIVASDGLWDGAKNEEVAAVVRSATTDPALLLAQKGAGSYFAGTKNKFNDDTTVVVLDVSPTTTSRPAPNRPLPPIPPRTS